MSLSGMLVSYGLKHALDLSADKVISWVEERFTDQSQTLLKALEKANDHAWNAVGLALGGGSFWDRLKSRFDATLSGVREELQKFIDLHPLPADGPEIRAKALEEFQRLRKAGR